MPFAWLKRMMTDGRSEEQRLDDAWRADNRAYLEEHLPRLSLEDRGRLAERVAAELLEQEETFDKGAFEAALDKAVFEERRLRYVHDWSKRTACTRCRATVALGPR